VILRIGGGSLGGKGEGLVMIDGMLWLPVAGSPLSLDGVALRDSTPGLLIDAPRTAIIGVEVFEEFVRGRDLRAAACAAYAEGEEGYQGRYALLREAFLEAPLPDGISGALADFMPEAGKPLIARSSSLLEDSEGEPFSGIYESYAIPNSLPHPAARLEQLLDAVRLVYASLFSPDAMAYRASCSRRRGFAAQAAESMAVVVQELVGSRRGRWYYPAVSGTAESLNYYPLSYAEPEDGLGVAALGLGSYVVEGGASHRFCPRYPALDAAPPELAGQGSQRLFRALDLELTRPELRQGESASLADLDIAEAEGTDALGLSASTWDMADGRLVPGTGRPGMRVLDFAPLLKHGALPFADAIAQSLAAAEAATGGPVELEYALDRSFPGGPETLFLLQLKRIRRSGGSGVELESLEAEGRLVASDSAMGDGRIEGVRDIVIVEPARFDRERSAAAAEELAAMDRELAGLGRRYLLVGPGRWGSRDPRLGVPVSYPQIANAAVIVETEMPGLSVDFSFGSHFLRNVAGRGIGYLAVPERGGGVVEWEALAALPRAQVGVYCSWIRLEAELVILLDGRRGRALVRL
jgi:hypothetical protein